MRNPRIGAACAAASLCLLAGCAGVRTEVLTSQTQNDLRLEHSYVIARSPLQEASSDQARYEALVRRELGRYGLVDAAAGQAHYVLSIAYDTRPASVAIDAGDCAEASCRNTDSARFLWFNRSWKHTLTLRFLDPASGDEVYKVSATSRDGDADAQRAAPYLVKSALAQLPFAQHRHWRIELRPAAVPNDTPSLVSVKPVQQ
ncbi:DUF4136 domain-containing protein [Paraburkholderia solisilvae]|uniref:DUF4136 domain-containing protein n=1 Tax=Paraburkholderia solisilvae TaxID=624376 RepID=A0A6J5DEQ3_9BURK|nr:DUF4136 domain-containing protein [Paraburkholderia solisilvae]CAB3751465.1 hypothetical protein LMG29739_01283 [Paraburkholderia solisilvae]